MPKTDPLDVIAEICHDQPHDALSRIADELGYTEGSVVLTPKDAAFLGARLRRLFAHFKVAVPDGGDDARLIGHAAAGIGLLLTVHAHGLLASCQQEESPPDADASIEDINAARDLLRLGPLPGGSV
jgi:hypothetical protein